MLVGAERRGVVVPVRAIFGARAVDGVTVLGHVDERLHQFAERRHEGQRHEQREHTSDHDYR